MLIAKCVGTTVSVTKNDYVPFDYIPSHLNVFHLLCDSRNSVAGEGRDNPAFMMQYLKKNPQ